MKIEEWQIVYGYSSSLQTEIKDLDEVAKLIVSAGVASSAHMNNGLTYWLDQARHRVRSNTFVADANGTVLLEQAPADLGLTDWTRENIGHAIRRKSAESRILSGLAADFQDNVRFQLEPLILTTHFSRITLYPTLKLFRCGSYTFYFRVISGDHPIDIEDFVEQYVNLYNKNTTETWLPERIAQLLYTLRTPSFFQRLKRLGRIGSGNGNLHHISQPHQIGDFEFSLYPGHLTYEYLEYLVNWIENTKGSNENQRNDGSESDNDPLPLAAVGITLPETYTALERIFLKRLNKNPSRFRFALFGEKPVKKNIGIWISRPRVTILKFDRQPHSAQAIRQYFHKELGAVLARVPRCPEELAGQALGRSVRVFDDYTHHINREASLCVYTSDLYKRSEEYGGFERDEELEIGILAEYIDFLDIRCRQLESRASKVTSAADARLVAREISKFERTVINAFHPSEYANAANKAWEDLHLTTLLKGALNDVRAAAEESAENTAKRSQQVNIVLAIVFGLVGTTGLTDAVTLPLWQSIGFPFPGNSLAQPFFFVVSATLVAVTIAVVLYVARHK